MSINEGGPSDNWPDVNWSLHCISDGELGLRVTGDTIISLSDEIRDLKTLKLIHCIALWVGQL